MVKTWIADIHSLYDVSCYRQYYEQAPRFRREKADQCRSVKGKAQSIGVWSLWEMIKKRYGLDDQTVYNFSHSGDYVLCSAVVDAEPGVQLGCDIEQVAALNLKVAKRFYCPSEYQKILEQKSEEERRETFFRFWVLKESFLKATRKGMALDTRSFEILLGEQPRLLKQPEEFPGRYYYREYKLSGIPYRAAVCSTDGMIDAQIQTELKL